MIVILLLKYFTIGSILLRWLLSWLFLFFTFLQNMQNDILKKKKKSKNLEGYYTRIMPFILL
jgi:hypothetical protein